MTRIETTGGSGWVEVVKEDPDSAKEVYVTAYECGASLSLVEVQDLILALAKTAGFKVDKTGNGLGAIIQFPESPAVPKRRDELSVKFCGYEYNHEHADADLQHAIEFIIEGEIARGELR